MLPRAGFLRALAAALVIAAVPTRTSAQDPQSPTLAPPAGADVIVIIPDSLRNAPRTLSELLREGAPSASVNRSTGALGASAFVSLRDASVVRGDDPLVVIDGIRQVSYRGSLDTLDRRAPSILDDVMLDEVERVEILNGPAAAANYGYDGQRGVVVVTTRRPGTGRARMRASVTTSAADANASFARNFTRVNANGTACPLFYGTGGVCSATTTTRYTPLLDRSPFRSAEQGAAHLGVTGGLGALGYAAALGVERGTGTMEANAADRTTGSLRLALPVSHVVHVALASYATERGISLPAEGVNSVLAAGVGGGPLDCSPTTPCGSDSSSGGYRIAPLAELASRGTHRRLDRLGGGLTVDIDPAASISLRTSVMADFLRDRASRLDTARSGLLWSASRYGSRERNWRVAAEQEARLAAPLGAAIATTRLSFRADAERSHDRSSAVSVAMYGGAAPIMNVSSSAAEVALFRNRLAASLDERLAWGNRVALGVGAIRAATAFRAGPHVPTVIDPHADAMVQLLPDAATLGILSSFRLRTAYGQASGHDERMFGDMRYFANPGGVRAIGYTPPPPRNLPDRSIELEGGFDAALSVAALRLSVTGFRRRERIERFLPIVVAMQDIDASARRRVTGSELVVETTPLDQAGARLHLRGQLALSHDRVEGPAASPLWLQGEPGFHTTLAPGSSWGEWNSMGLARTDTNGDKRIDANEIYYANTDFSSRARSRPSSIASLSSDLEIAHSFVLTAVVDHIGGFDVYDQTGALQCSRGTCLALNDPNASLDDQARAVAAAERLNTGFLVPGDATHLRELSLSWRADGRAALVHAASLAVTLSAYDVASWTRSRGIHPETDTPAPGYNGNFLWNVVQPIPRTFALRVALGY